MVNGFFTWPSLYTDMVKRFDNGSIFVEVGLLEGKSIIYLINQILISGKNIKVIGVDHFEDQSGGLLNSFNRNTDSIKERFELIINKSVSAAEGFKDKSVDFVFIDAAHDYENVRDDIEAWSKKIKKGGIIAGHDYFPTYPGVMKAVDMKYGNKLNKDYIHEGCWLVQIN